MLPPMNSEDTNVVISLPASASGTEHLTTQDGKVPSGPVPAPANLSARQAKERGLLTSGTYGPRSSISSNSAVLSRSLASKLRLKTDSLGSTLYRLTWKDRATPSGRLIPALRASVLRTYGKDFIGWPSPSARDWKNGKASQETLDRNARPLNEMVMLSGWNTPRATDGSKGGPNQANGALPPDAALSGWPTPKTPSGGRSVSIDKMDATGRMADGRKHTASLEHAVKFAGPIRLTASGKILTGSSAGMESGGQLDPAHSLWLMLGPDATAWLNYAERVTRSISRRRKPLSK